MIKLPKQVLINILWENHDTAEVLQDTIVGTSRWSERHEIVFKYNDATYITHYSCGATENQDESPFEYANDEVECYEAELVNQPKWVVKKDVIR